MPNCENELQFQSVQTQFAKLVATQSMYSLRLSQNQTGCPNIRQVVPKLDKSVSKLTRLSRAVSCPAFLVPQLCVETAVHPHMHPYLQASL